MKTIILTVVIGGLLIIGIAQLPFVQNVIPDADLPAQALQTEPETSTTTLLFVGDMMMGRNVELLMDRHGDSYAFQHISDYLKSFDTVIGNLEGPVLSNHTRTPSKSVRFDFHTRMPGVLAQNNIGIVSLANNHTYDFGKAGYDETVKHVRAAGIDAAGHPFAFGDAYVLRKTVNDQKFVFVGFNITNPNFNFVKAREFARTVQVAPDEFYIAMIHGGEEYQLISNKTQKNFNRGLIDDGMDLVIGHHPHVVQDAEKYKGKMIFYSLGNFIFDQYFSKDTQEGLTVKATFVDGIVSYELIPIKSDRSKVHLMSEKEKAVFLKRFSALQL
jgi:gamma-polyglutamate biosynthesis protein CapA